MILLNEVIPALLLGGDIPAIEGPLRPDDNGMDENDMRSVMNKKIER